jgi:twitching motility protein PilT
MSAENEQQPPALEIPKEDPWSDNESSEVKDPNRERAQQILKTIFELASVRPVSDFHIKTSFVRVQTHKGIETLPEFRRLSQSVVEEILWMLYNSQNTSIEVAKDKLEMLKLLSITKVLDFSAQGSNVKSIKTGRLRVQAYYDSAGTAITARILNNNIPQLEGLGFSPDHANTIRIASTKRSGLILVTGATGNGKSTTLASILDYIRLNHPKHIITVEDPIEFHYKDHMPQGDDIPSVGMVTQQEIGRHVKSYQQGLTDALRKHPDIILIGEVRDHETMETCLHAAQTGHLVFTTLHTRSATRTLDRILEMFPNDKEKGILGMLAENLIMILSQGLLKRENAVGKALCYEILSCDEDTAVKASIRKYRETGAGSGLKEALKKRGNMEWQVCLQSLCDSNTISPETAASSRLEAPSGE